ncbi:MAG: formylmethanofuran dehydrogenase subunit A [Candidatus Heimdallarchaeota archaeon]|nr:formylmethanofuran dehydrogenase subunit A [Candidatus Heimdallarchaeota archaeon]
MIKNGRIFDPANNIHGEKKDLVVLNDKIINPSKLPKKAKVKTIDATGLVIMAGGVDIHTHIAGPKVNSGRLLRPEDHRKEFMKKTAKAHSGVGWSVPSTYFTGYAYAKLGYTTAMEAAMPPLEARHTHEELMDTPIIDKAAYTLLGSNWFLLERISEMEFEEMCAITAWLLKASGGYSIKLVNPGGEETWAWGQNVEHLDDSIASFSVTPREIIKTLARINERLKLPHSIHLHTNNLGLPGNYVITKETMELLRGVNPQKNRKTNVHVTHMQFSSYGGEDWKSFRSEAQEISHYINKHDHVSCDVGQVIFTDTTTMTADGAWEWVLRGITEHLSWSPRSGSKWINGQVELETSSGVVPYIFRRKNPVNAVQWAIGLEFILSIKDLTKVNISTDHPNGGPFIYYPAIFSWLMSQKARKDMLNKASKFAIERSHLSDITREFSLSEIAQISRVSAAKILGFTNKGHLGINADADIAIYNFKCPIEELSDNYPEIEKGFAKAAYTIKDGQIVVKDGEIIKDWQGRTFRVQPIVPKDWEAQVQEAIQERFKKYYTVSLDNYPIQQEYFPKEEIISSNAE